MKDKEQIEIINEILEALQEKYIITIDWNYINKNYGKFKWTYGNTIAENDK